MTSRDLFGYWAVRVQEAEVEDYVRNMRALGFSFEESVTIWVSVVTEAYGQGQQPRPRAILEAAARCYCVIG